MGGELKMYADSISKTLIPIIYQRGQKRYDCTDLIVQEQAVTIYVGDYRVATIMCTPDCLAELAVGFLFSEGILDKITDLESVTVDMENSVILTEIKNYSDSSADVAGYGIRYSGCGVCGNSPDIAPPICGGEELGPIISEHRVIDLMNSLQNRSLIFRKTGGAHCAALADSQGLITRYEDISRNNALDKVIGHAMIRGIDTKNKIIVFSGRISSEIARKVCRLQCSILIARSAPTDMALSMADRCGITVTGFTRGECFNLYTHPQRIQKDSRIETTIKEGEVKQ